jgi:hypothetical protein
MSVTITPEALATSAAKYRKELLWMPVLALNASLQHMMLRTGIRGKETVGQLSGDMQLGPYSATRKDTDGVNVKGRVLETYFGSVVKEFEPNTVVKSIYGDAILSGKELTDTQIVKMVVAYLAKQLSKNLNKVLWSAVRNDEGSTTADLFNGFDTISAVEIAAGTISVALGNLYEFTEAITSSNALDQLKAYYRAAHDVLQEEVTKMFLPKKYYQYYCDDYQATVGAAPYNKEFKKTFLEGSDDTCELVALANKKDSPYIHLTTKSNMLVGVNQEGEEEKITVEKHAAFILQFVVAMFFGVQFESISPEKLLVGKLFVAPQG